MNCYGHLFDGLDAPLIDGLDAAHAQACPSDQALKLPPATPCLGWDPRPRKDHPMTTTSLRDFRNRSRRTYSFVDLFCGAGGFSEGFMLAANSRGALRPIAASDINDTVQQTYENRFCEQLGLGLKFVPGDIRHPSVRRRIANAVAHSGDERPDIVCGGPPCQGFALFGARQRTDPRNDLFLSYLKMIEVLQPSYFVMENVPGLVHMYKGSTVPRIREAVEAMSEPGYVLTGPLFVNAADYGVPQIRERVLFIGSRTDMPLVDSVPPQRSPESYVTVGEAIGDLAFLRPWEHADTYDPSAPVDSEYQAQSRRGRLIAELPAGQVEGALWNHQAARHSPDVIARFSVMTPGSGLESIPRSLWDTHLQTKKKWCVRLRSDRASNTVVTLPDDLVHPTQPRILTVRELARLQSFDDTFRFLGPRATGGGGRGNKLRTVQVPQYSQVGNAIPPLLARAVGERLLAALASAAQDATSDARAQRDRHTGEECVS